ncbi:MAG: hypothetical protein UW62_C0030G0006 [Candidatus Collierbacteria bacterium GW2011_GWB1_44_35]|uniref:Uncharacterized protein n=5 Tax=Candidatus Collieribacteriota TaxID=1752725 RepID=A0A0G1P537_9BACT|nr:MAG: hypothetical protein UW26_C0022G0004 [Candidatus Collierbacteria bacterium GW2011_GWF1_44_12]KKT67184.1 MAG: hypothetical protein UW62_C0030G0006 [Candidatus Collierbacteria bacterium GW2011_GWB1_44_35]KKU27677.1 MAG: hypothetical protein UX41_C0045G0005 [Candidatus Collierbacteria bacterium GW2011_GWE1_46_18]
MEMPVIVGVILALIFIVAFSGWFFHLASGWNQFVLDDIYFKYRIFAATFLSISVITATFIGMAYAFECPNEEREGIFASLNCADYRNIKTGTESLFKRSVVKQEELQIVLPVEDEGEFIFDQ